MNNDTRVELEALITEREGYIAENIHRQLCGNSIAYGADAFNDLADRMRALKEGSTMTDAELVEAAALERQISELTRKNCGLQEKLDEYENAYKFIMDDKCFNEEKHCACAPILRAKVKELEAENAMLRKQVEQKLKIEQLDCLRRIRDAVGDNGKMMQDELVDHIADLSKMVETLRKRLEVACHVKADDKVGFDFAVLDKIDSLERERDKVRNIVKFLEERLRHYYKVMEKRYNRIEDLESENALLRKRLEPIETAHREYKEYPSSAIVKRDAYDKAISKCMELKEGE